jgi:hypothetical protein
MANQKTTALTALTTLADADLFYVVDDVAGTPTSKKLTAANLLAYIEAEASAFMPVAEPYHIQVALSANGAAIAAGTKKGLARVPKAGNITAFVIDCDPANEPSAAAVQVDLNKIARDTGTATSVLSAVAEIATGGNTGTGTINGTQSVSAGDLLTLDIDQGSDGKELIATITITPT